jgi:hypothetical protein
VDEAGVMTIAIVLIVLGIIGAIGVMAWAAIEW